jgi:hypothetical protein
MDLVTRADLEQLARPDQPSEVHVSLFIPTHRLGDGVSGDRIRWKNLVKQVQSDLERAGSPAPQVSELLKPAWALHDDGLAWQYMSDGLAFFLRPGWHRMYRVPVVLPEVATVGSRFVAGPLVRIISDDSHFLVLAVSQRKVRLLEGSLQHVEEVDLGDIPTSLRDVIEPAQARSDTMAWVAAGPVGGRAGRAVFYGHGAADEDLKKDEVRRFLQQVAGGLRDYLVDQQLPMVLVGLDHLVSMYREVNVYPHVIDRDVRRNADQLSGEQLHAAAWPLADEVLARQRTKDVERFEELHGTGRASNDPHEIEDAARQGRVDTLFLAVEPWCWEQVPTGKNAVVQLGADETFAHCERLDAAVAGTFARRGVVHTLHAADVPGGGDMAAVFRY